MCQDSDSSTVLLHLIAEKWAAVQDLAARPDTPYARDVLDGSDQKHAPLRKP